MPGAWELQESVLCCILHTEATTMAWAAAFRNLIIPGGYRMVSGMPFDHARNACAMMALETGADALFFLDSDVLAPPDTILRLLSHKQPIISGVYHRRASPVGVPVMIKNGQWYHDYPPNQIVEVDMVGAGCLLIRRQVLESFPAHAPGKQWFHWLSDQKGVLPQGECFSEDFAFCIAAKKNLGIPTLVDTSIQCAHVGLAASIRGGFHPLDNVRL